MTAAQDWSGHLTGEQQARALDAVRIIAGRVTQRNLIREGLDRARTQTRFPTAVYWHPPSVAQGDAGQALLCAELANAFPHENWTALGDEFLRSAAEIVHYSDANTSIVSGLPGLAFAARSLAGSTRRYDGLIAQWNRLISQAALATLTQLVNRSGVPTATFDLISGLSGLVTYLLPRISSDVPGAALPFVVKGLCNLALSDGTLPSWHTPTELLFDDDQRRHYPYGNLNCGLAHGIPGPLAALSLVALYGYQTTELQQAIQRLAEWLILNATEDRDGPRWAAMIPLAKDGAALSPNPEPTTRDAWCYGSPGVARSLYLAGRASNRPDWCEFAVAAMVAVYRRPPKERAIDAPTFCHGVAGLLQITLRFAHDTRQALFHQAASELTDQLLAAVDTTRPFGVANIEPGGILVDQPGLLDGATGTCLTLLSAASNEPPGWDRVLAIA